LRRWARDNPELPCPCACIAAQASAPKETAVTLRRVHMARQARLAGKRENSFSITRTARSDSARRTDSSLSW